MRAREQLTLGVHTYTGPKPTAVGYLATCACGWRSGVRNQPRTKRAALGRWHAHTREVRRHGV